MEMAFRCTCTPLSDVHSPISTDARRSAFKIRLQGAACNFCLPHSTLTRRYGKPMSPAMAAGLEDRVWTMRDVVERMDADREIMVA